MGINIENNLPNINVSVNRTSNGDISIVLKDSAAETVNQRRLLDVPCGDTVMLGSREFIVLGHSDDTTAVLSKKAVKHMEFGATGDWCNSDVRNFCNGEFYQEMGNAIGRENIIPHTVKLMADDGTGKDLRCKDYISILTADLYRRYRAHIPAMSDSWWLATRVTHEVSGYARCVCFVNSDGLLVWNGCVCSRGVRPFLILNSNILVP